MRTMVLEQFVLDIFLLNTLSWIFGVALNFAVTNQTSIILNYAMFHVQIPFTDLEAWNTKHLISALVSIPAWLDYLI